MIVSNRFASMSSLGNVTGGNPTEPGRPRPIMRKRGDERVVAIDFRCEQMEPVREGQGQTEGETSQELTSKNAVAVPK